RDKHPDRIGLYLGFNEGLAHVIEAGSDLFLMPSRYEPCGLNQMYSQRYGTPPVVRATGGLADTVVNATEENLAAGTATGFSFRDDTAAALYETVRWALALLRDRPADFRRVVRTAMAQDWSWDRSAAAYEDLYRKVTRSEEHTSELQSPYDLVCRLLLEKKKKEVTGDTRAQGRSLV